MKTAHDFLRPFVGAEPGPYLNCADAVKAVQAVIDHYDPLPGSLNLAYRVVDAPRPPLPNVFPPACPRCTQRFDQCLCPPLFPREEPPFNATRHHLNCQLATHTTAVAAPPQPP